MLGSVPLSAKALGDDTILLAGVAEMTALGVQTSVGVGTLVGEASLSANLTQTSVGDLLFTDISPSVTVTWSNIAHTGDTWTEVTHTGDSWTDVTHTGDSWTDVTHTGDTWTDITP